MIPLAISEGSVVTIIVATIASVPLFLSSLAAFRKTSEVADQVAPRNGSGLTTGQLIEEIYSDIGALKGMLTAHLVDSEAHYAIQKKAKPKPRPQVRRRR